MNIPTSISISLSLLRSFPRSDRKSPFANRRHRNLLLLFLRCITQCKYFTLFLLIYYQMQFVSFRTQQTIGHTSRAVGVSSL